MAKPKADVFYAALAAEYGVIWKILDGARPEEHRKRFYEIKEELGDPDLDEVSIKLSRIKVGGKMRFGSDLWLVNSRGHHLLDQYERTPPNDPAQGGVPTGTQDPESSQGDL